MSSQLRSNVLKYTEKLTRVMNLTLINTVLRSIFEINDAVMLPNPRVDKTTYWHLPSLTIMKAILLISPAIFAGSILAWPFLLPKSGY